MSGLIFRLPGFFTDTTIPKLYRDKVITAGTKYCFDSKDTYSFEKQAAPAAGLDVWKNLLEGGDDATFAGPLGFEGGGFSFKVGATDIIKLPASGVAPANANAFVTAIWIKLGTPTPATSEGIFGASDNFGDDKNQYSAHLFNNGGSVELKLYIGAVSATVLVRPPADSIAQIGWSALKREADGKYDLKFYLNGVVVGSGISAGTSLPVPVDNTNPRFGYLNRLVGVNWTGSAYRVFYDDCSVKTAESLIALDYADNHLRIAGVAQARFITAL